MKTHWGAVRGGVVELTGPLDFRDGTEVEVRIDAVEGDKEIEAPGLAFEVDLLRSRFLIRRGTDVP